MNQKEISFFDIYEKEQASFIKKFDDSDEIKIKKIGNYYYKIIEKDKSSVGKSGCAYSLLIILMKSFIPLSVVM